MIYCLFGENTYTARHWLRDYEAKQGRAERYDAEDVAVPQLHDVFMAATLFEPERRVVLMGASEAKPLWEALESWATTLPEDVTVILIDKKPDKRTKTYKALAKHATIIPCDLWTQRDIAAAQTWLEQEARALGMTLKREVVRMLIDRAMTPADKPGQVTIDQQRLATALRALAVLDEVTDDAIETVLPASPRENVFDILEIASRGDEMAALRQCQQLAVNNDGYMVMGLLVSQWVNVVALSLGGDRSSQQVATDVSAHPFVMQKLAGMTNVLSPRDIRELTLTLAELDMKLKTSGIDDPWLAVERFVRDVAQRAG